MKTASKVLMLAFSQLVTQPFSTSKKSETEEFRKVDERVFKQGIGMQHPAYGIVKCKYDFPAEFFINPDNTIAYMSGNIQNISIFSSKYPDLVKEYLEQMDKSDLEKHFMATSTTYDGTPIVTGNFNVSALNDIFGEVTIRIPSEMFVEDLLLRDVTKRDADSVVGNHKLYVKDLEIMSDPNLTDKLAEIYKRLNNFHLRI